MMSAPSRARRTAWLRPWPRAAPVISATLPATRPGRAPSARRSRAAPAAAGIRRGRGAAADGHGQASAFQHGIEHASRRHAVAGPQRARPRQVEGLLGEPVAAVDDHRGSRWRAARRSTRPRAGPGRPGRPRTTARSSRRTPARCRRVLASARSPVRDSRVPATWSGVTRATSRPAPASHSATPTPTGPPTGSCTTTGPSGKEAGSLCQQDQRIEHRARPVHRDGHRRRQGPGGQHHLERPRPGRRRGRPSRPRRPVSTTTPWARHSATSHSASPARRSRPGPTAAARRAPPARSDRSTTRTRCPRADSTRAHSSPATPAPTISTSPLDRIGPVHRGLERLVAAAGLAHAAHHRVAVVPDMAGLVAEDAGPHPGAVAAAHQGHQARLGDLGPGHLDQVGRPVVEGGLGHRRVDDAALQHDGGPAGRRLSHLAAQPEVEGGLGVGCRGGRPRSSTGRRGPPR